jgi:kynureninase
MEAAIRPLSDWRSEFPILDRSVYLISNSLGAMPRGATEALALYAETWATRGVRAWEERWWEMGLEVGNKVARIIGAPPGSVSMHENVTSAEMVVLSSLAPGGRRRTIVALEADFPSNIYLYRMQAAGGFGLKLVPMEADFTCDEQKVLDAIDDTTAIVCLSHVLFRSSFIMDPAPIVERAHRASVPVLLDGYQSAGIIPVDVTALGVDFFVGGCLKGLCGGPGNAFLYTRPDLLKTTQPRFTGWLSHRTPFSFATGELDRREDAMRMMNGTPSIPAWYAALAGLDIVGEVGVSRIRDHSTALTRHVFGWVDRLRSEGFFSIASRDPERLAGTVAVNVPEALAVSRKLKANDFVIDYRPGVGIRVSPHFYNTRDEIDRLMTEMARIVAEKDYETGGEARSLVT